MFIGLQQSIQMDYFPSGVGALRQLYPENVPLNISSVGHRLNHYVHRQEEVFCPEPRRIVGKNFAADTPNRLCSKHRRLVKFLSVELTQNSSLLAVCFV